MREIKFRAWNTRRKEMEMIDDMYWFEENQCHHNGDNDYVIQQYTGLKDKNGVEIFEGDIVTVPWTGECILVELGPDDGNFHYLVTNYDNRYPPAFEVIGNIHENPELLKEQT